ncbi:MAG: ATP-binding protein [Syntrophomonadaceae bacterium]|jgi:magnesium chelatase subunit I|nr:magnesium chelatase [Bacillota bacterium]NLM88706.1 magnesium chelatase [Syntrophomonadaceae bacterium]HAA09022.1 magnesium chelatase [Syntrophomonas sp.]HQA49132.1 magnesium chelatase [Syntrophomonadaceae bacterium]HQD89497.1 magnesium chelatase [Syntrophomonadaceae bacterium]
MIPFAKLERYEGNESLFELVLMSVVSTLVGEPLHIHAEGLRGTGKTTIMRAARGILPNITRIKGCIYNCDPERPHCPQHKNMTAPELAELGTEEIPMPFLEISHSAKVGTVAGSIDLSRLTDSTQPEARLLPGLIPQAHRGILFIDEINRLADTSPEITDILLDVMGNKPGHIQIEEAGLPVVEIPVSVSVWAASNPDEDPGPLEEIRRQLSDRFDMVCYMGRPDSVDILAQMLKENSHAYKNKRYKDSHEEDDPGNEVYRKNIVKWAGLYEQADLPDFLRNFIARLYIKHNLESIRAIEAMQQGAVLHSIIRGHDKVLINDVTDMIPLVLKHRVDGDTLIKMINDVDSRSAKDGILTFRGRKNKKSKKEDEPDYFPQNARPLKDMSRGELINTEKTLTPSDY